jgi:hypothetical protein
MTLRERAWRRKVARMVRLLDERLTGIDTRAFEASAKLIGIRERLAGALGAEEGHTSTPELRRRASEDFAEAARFLDLEKDGFEPPEGDPPEVVLRRGFASFRQKSPVSGDRC